MFLVGLVSSDLDHDDHSHVRVIGVGSFSVRLSGGRSPPNTAATCAIDRTVTDDAGHWHRAHRLTSDRPGISDSPQSAPNHFAISLFCNCVLC